MDRGVGTGFAGIRETKGIIMCLLDYIKQPIPGEITACRAVPALLGVTTNGYNENCVKAISAVLRGDLGQVDWDIGEISRTMNVRAQVLPTKLPQEQEVIRLELHQLGVMLSYFRDRKKIVDEIARQLQQIGTRPS